MAISVPAPMATPMSALVSAGRVVDAVADHHDFALLSELADDVFLAVRQDACDDFINACLSADGLCGAGVITGEHDDVNAMFCNSRMPAGCLP